MKLIGFLFLLSLLQACDPWGYGYKNNPAYVLNEAFEAVIADNAETFVKISGKEALCVYGNKDGVSYLRDHLNIKTENIEIKPKILSNFSKKLTETPLYVGYWSYYQERHEILIQDKNTSKDLLKVLVECHFGFSQKILPTVDKNGKKQPVKIPSYKVKECKVIKVMPYTFAALPVKKSCESLKVNYSH